MKELGDGTRDIIASTTGWDINPRVLGIVPKSAEVARLKGFHWVSDAQYMAIPKGVAEEKLAGAARAHQMGAAAPTSRPSPTTRAISIRGPP